jgi:multiple sugar transport system ATP-binding protein
VAHVAVEAVRKVYPNGHVAVGPIDLTVADGELMVLVGPSGCGKSTLLRLIAGLETPTAGHILIDGRDVTSLPPQNRDVAMVFQSYALYPHLTVRENLGFGLRMRHTPRERITEQVDRAAAALGLEPLLDRKPGQLSGGQRQRVALGRAMVRNPKVFLLDEPLSNLDAQLRMETRAELARLHRRLRATSVYVTHDQEEAMTLGERMAVIRNGRIEQVAEPLEVYRRPASLFVAEFVGAPAMNLLPGELQAGRQVRLAGATTLPLEGVRGDPPAHARVVLGVRPQDVTLVDPSEGDLAARVDVVEQRGSDVLVRLRLESGAEMRVVAAAATALEPEVLAGLRLDRARLHWFDPETGQRLQ